MATESDFVQKPKTYPNAANSFSLEVDGLPLTSWTGCEGLSAEYDVQTYQEGGQNGYEIKLIGRIKYGNVKLSRYVNTESSEKIAPWFSNYNKVKASRQAFAPQPQGSVARPSVNTQGKVKQRQHVVIRLHDATGKVIATWTLMNAHPLKWTGPQFSTDGNGLLKETIEFVHHGFAVNT